MSKTFQTQGVLIHKFTVGENDTLATWYTREHGRIRTKVRGAKKINSKFTGHLEYLNLCELTIHEGRSNLILTECELTNPFQQIKSDLPKLDQSFDIIKIINSITYEQETIQDIEDLYQLFTSSLQAITESPHPEIVAEHFKINLLLLMGLIQDIRECAFCDDKFTPEHNPHLSEKGSFICEKCRPQIQTLSPINFRNLKLIHFFSTTTPNQANKLKLTKDELTDLQRLTYQLLHLHFPKDT